MLSWIKNMTVPARYIPILGFFLILYGISRVLSHIRRFPAGFDYKRLFLFGECLFIYTFA